MAQDSPTFDGQSFTSNRNRVTTRYNSLFQVYSVTQPYFANASPTASTTYSYDVLNRPTSVNKPACSIPETYGYSDGGLYVTKTNCDSEVTVAWSSGSGVKIQTKDALGNITTMQPAPFGKTHSVTDPAGNNTTYAYDNIGNVTSLSDPDSDNWISTFDSFGELATKTHNTQSSQETYYFYDKLGRLTKRQDYGSNATDNWTYGATNSAGTLCDGQLARESTSGGYSVTYSYDGLCRETNRLYGGNAGSFATSYDQTTGRVTGITYPSGVVVSSGYSGGHYPNEMLVATGGGSAHLFSEINTANAALQPMTGTSGDGVGTVWSWDGNNRLSDITSGPSGSANSVQNLGYQYDGLGNVTYRRDSVTGLSENFTYDADNQLTASYLNGDTTGNAFAYDALGNLTYRSDLGILTYGYSGKPHTLASIQVDPNSPYAGTIGSIESNSYSWTWFNKVSEATVGGDSFQYEYDNRHQRYTQYDSAWSRTTTYLRGPGGTEEDIVGAVIHDLIPGVGGIAGEVVNNGANLLYYHKDQLGSLTAVSGGNAEIDSYDAWGKRRMTNGGDDTTCYVSSVAIRGYIAEEQNAPSCPLINLNARMYDPITTRFLSPDPMGLAAGPNPYAYAANNPLTSKDPSGLDCADYGCGEGDSPPGIYIVGCNGGCGGGLDVSGLLGGLSSPPISAPAEDAVQTDQTSDPTPLSDDQSVNNGCGPGPTVCAANAENAVCDVVCSANVAVGLNPKGNGLGMAAQIDDYLANKDSPLWGEGLDLVYIGQYFDLDPRLLVAISGAETGFGLAITAGANNFTNDLYNGPAFLNGVSNPSPFNSAFTNFRGTAYTLDDNGYNLSSTTSMYTGSPNYCSGALCGTEGLPNLNFFLIEQGGNPYQLRYPWNYSSSVGN